VRLIFEVAAFFFLVRYVHWTKVQSVATERAANAAKDSADTARIVLRKMRKRRPEIVFGLSNGSVADYIPPTRGQQKGTILIHFRNTGDEPSPNTLFNAYSDLLPSDKGEIRHLLRYRAFYKGQPSGLVGGGGTDIASQAQYDLPLDQKWVPNPAQWRNIENRRQRYGGFRVQGTFEYCDQWGVWRCDTFFTSYDPNLRKFVSTTMPPMGCEYTTEAADYLAMGADYRAEILPPCEQPDERAQHGGATHPVRVGTPRHITASSGNFGVPMPTPTPTATATPTPRRKESVPSS
jgi:hypothetical protein